MSRRGGKGTPPRPCQPQTRPPRPRPPPIPTPHTPPTRLRWWAEYADRKNDEGDEHVADSLLYDRNHLPRTAPAPDCVPMELRGGGGRGPGPGTPAPQEGGCGEGG